MPYAERWVSECGTVVLYRGDCLEVLPTLDANAGDLIATDPPYFKVKGEAWDRQWDKPEGFIAWIGQLCERWHRVLKPNGSLYVFASPKMAARVECKVAETFNVLNTISWLKPSDNSDRRHVAQIVDKGLARSFYPSGEKIVFAEHYGNSPADRGHTFGSVVEYLRAERDAAGLNNEAIDSLCGWKTKAFHFFARSGSNFCMPTAENYRGLQQAMPGRFLRSYDDLLAEFDGNRRAFNVTAGSPYTDVWTFRTATAAKHPCEKPVDLMEHIVTASSREGDTVLDSCMGRASTAIACLNTGRNFIGIEKDEAYFNAAKRRISEALAARNAQLIAS